MKFKIINKLNIYMLLINVVGIITFILIGDYSFNSNSDWVLGYAFIGSCLLLNYFKMLLPPMGNALSIDSAIYLASVFIFGLEFTLSVFFFYSIIYFLFDRSAPWWAHIFNFSMYNIMISTAYISFTQLGGTVGTLDLSDFFVYLGSMVIYFILNVFFMGIFFYLAGRTSLIDSLKDFLNGTIESYTIILLLSLILSILLENNLFFGLLLFIIISLILSFTFRQQFTLYQSVKNKANRDQLTGLYNHGYFKEKLDEEFEETKKFDKSLSMAMLDIDDFKIFNDSNGHMKGDHVLTLFGEILQKKCEDRSYTVARYGGEEFSILMPDTTETEANDFIDCLRKEVNDTYVEGVERLPYGCLSYSAGIVEWHKEIYSPSEFLMLADQAMYYAKEQGKNNTHIYGHEFEPFEIATSMGELEQQLKLFLAKDIYTYRHSKRVFKFAVEFGKYLNLNEQEKKILTLGALVHDIGKLELPRSIINKTGKLTADEWELIKQHVTWGKDILAVDKRNEALLPLVELHHERFDGKGYPHGLIGDTIPKLARILCVIDSFDAMTTERPYKKTKTYEDGLVELRACSGTQFDPYYAEAFIDYFKKESVHFEPVVNTL